MKTSFDHEKLSVYQEAIRFAAWVGDLLETHRDVGAHRLDAGGLDPQHLR
ncbi:MAG: hypothetical protein WC328_01165 [Kiritimatiellia bacterium]|jgi:hypothetical protein|nr:hypothetical protein [Kiritimatiellia bacterium]